MKDEMKAALFNEFLTKEREYEIQFRHPYYVAKEPSLNGLEYEVAGNILYVESEYVLTIKLDCDDIPEHLKDEPNCKDREISGPFSIEIDINKKLSIPDLALVKIIDDLIYSGTWVCKFFCVTSPAFTQ